MSLKYVEICVGEHLFGIPLLNIKEMIPAEQDIRPMPQTPSYFLGLINLRGDVISVIDLRKKLNVKDDIKPEDKEEAISIVEFGDGLKMGMLVDSINRVLTVNEEDIQSLDTLNSQMNGEYIEGVVNYDDNKLVSLMNLNAILNNKDLINIKNKQNTEVKHDKNVA